MQKSLNFTTSCRTSYCLVWLILCKFLNFLEEESMTWTTLISKIKDLRKVFEAYDQENEKTEEQGKSTDWFASKWFYRLYPIWTQAKLSNFRISQAHGWQRKHFRFYLRNHTEEPWYYKNWVRTISKPIALF